MDWKFRELDEDDVRCTSDPYYDLFYGGYINEHYLLEDEDQIRAVREAKLLIEDFMDSAAEHGILEII
jgi:hypothetical protein